MDANTPGTAKRTSQLLNGRIGDDAPIEIQPVENNQLL